MNTTNQNTGVSQGEFIVSVLIRILGRLILIGAFAVIVHVAATTIFQKGILTLALLIYLNSIQATQISPKEAEEEYEQGKLNDLDMQQAAIEAMVLNVITIAAWAYFIYVGYLALMALII